MLFLAALNKAVRKPAPSRIPLSLPSASSNDFYSIELSRDDSRILVVGKEELGFNCIVFGDEELGIRKVLDVDNIVTLMPVEIVKSERDKVWVTGLPDNVNIITVGQGFVAPGDKVNAHYQD